MAFYVELSKAEGDHGDYRVVGGPIFGPFERMNHDLGRDQENMQFRDSGSKWTEIESFYMHDNPALRRIGYNGINYTIIEILSEEEFQKNLSDEDRKRLTKFNKKLNKPNIPAWTKKKVKRA